MGEAFARALALALIALGLPARYVSPASGPGPTQPG